MPDLDVVRAATRVLVIDDEPSIRRSLTRVLSERGFEVETARTGGEGLKTAERWEPTVVLLDLKLPDATGLTILRALKERDPAVAVLMITAYGDVSEAVEALRLGAADFLKKPYELDDVVLSVTAAARRAALEVELARYRSREAETLRRDVLIGECEAIHQLRALIGKVARGSGTTVLLEGESGTGKEVVAQAIHRESDRRDGPFMDLNCAAVQETLLENELFGHERGAYTDARELKRGLAELAEGGTLFLDEVADMPPAVQAKLLRFLDGRTFKRVGGTREISVDLRVIAATNASLTAAVAAGRFRADLYYRLRVVSLTMPPLRERGGDVELLALHFLEHYARRFHKRFRDLSDHCRPVLRAYAWPGNVRELKNVIERAVLLEDDVRLERAHLPPEIALLGGGAVVGDDAESATRSAPPGAGGLGEFTEAETEAEDDVLLSLAPGLLSLDEVTDRHILTVLEHCHGNRSHAARVLGISRQGLLNRLRGLQEKLERPSA